MIGIAIVALLAPIAGAQILDLDGPASPLVGPTSAFIPISSQLIAEHDAILAQSRSPGARAMVSALEMQSALRELAAALISLESPHESPGAMRVVLGLRIADAMDEIDAIASDVAAAAVEGVRSARSDDPDTGAIEKWQRTRACAGAVTRGCGRIIEDLDRQSQDQPRPISSTDESMSDIAIELRPVLPEGTSAAPFWPAAEPGLARGSVRDAAAAIRPGALDAPTADAMARAFAALGATEHVAYLQRVRRAAAWTIVDAARAVDTLGAARIDPAITPGLRAGCEATAYPASRDRGLARIEAIGALGALADRATAVEADGVDITALREAMSVLAAGLVVPIDPAESTDDRALRTIEAISRIVDDVARTPRRAALEFKDARFNRAWRTLVRRHEELELRAFELAARTSRAPAILGTPEWVATAGALHNSRRTLERIAAVSGWIAELRTSDEGPVGAAVRAGAADRLTVIRKGIGYEEHQDAALAALAEWESMRALAAGLPGEDLLRAGDPRLSEVTRARPAALVRIIELARADWIGAWARADETARIEADQRVRRLHRLGEALVDAAMLREPDLADRISAWAPMRITPGALDSLRRRAEAVIAEACVAAIENRQLRLESLLDEWDTSCAAARFCARVGAASMVLPDWPAGDALDRLIGSLGHTPMDAWGADLRSPVAMVSVWAAELESAEARDDRGMADAIVRWMNHLSEPLIGAIARAMPPAPTDRD